jgi:hypothetical protein
MRRPRDKAKIEVGVQVVERGILVALLNRTFFSLAARCYPCCSAIST